MGRVKYAARNIMFGYVSNIITLLLNAVLRYVFIIRLDETLLGINSNVIILDRKSTRLNSSHH